MALAVDEGRNDAAVLTAGGLPVLTHIGLALLADGGSAGFTAKENEPIKRHNVL